MLGSFLQNSYGCAPIVLAAHRFCASCSRCSMGKRPSREWIAGTVLIRFRNAVVSLVFSGGLSIR